MGNDKAAENKVTFHRHNLRHNLLGDGYTWKVKVDNLTVATILKDRYGYLLESGSIRLSADHLRTIKRLIAIALS